MPTADGAPTFGAHAFIWSGDWTPNGSERAISGAAAAGLDFLEIPLLDPENMDIERTRDLLARHGIGCTCSLGLPKEVHLPFDPDGAQRFLEGAIRVTDALGSRVLTGCLYTHLGTLTGRPPEDSELEAVARVLKEVARYAADYDVRLGIEAVNRYETYLLNLASQASEMLDAVGEPNVFVHLDTYHMNIEEKGFHDPVVELGDRMQYIHLSESDRGVPGTGNVNWDDVFRGLADASYRGALVMESFAAVNEAIIGATALWRDVVGDPDALVTDGLAFLREKARTYGLIEDGAG